MNTENVIRKGRLADLRQQRMDLTVRIRGNLKAAKQLLVMSSIDPIEEIDVPAANVSMAEASKQYHELAEINRKIAALERELN